MRVTGSSRSIANRKREIQPIPTIHGELFNAGINRFGTDESKFNAILVTRSYRHLKMVFAEYKRRVRNELELDLKEILHWRRNNLAMQRTTDVTNAIINAEQQHRSNNQVPHRLSVNMMRSRASQRKFLPTISLACCSVLEKYQLNPLAYCSVLES
eukprot:sb/3473148/